MAIHVNTNTGETGTCRAKKGQCPFGGESGTENHYDTREEAVAAAEKHMESVYKDVHKGYVAKKVDGLGLPTDMKKRLIKEAAEGKLYGAIVGRTMAKDSDELIRKQVAENINSQKLLRDMSDDDSARVRKAVAQRTRNRAVLAKLANDSDAKVRYAAIHNSNTPVKARKAAQAAIREANLENLKKARSGSSANATV